MVGSAAGHDDAVSVIVTHILVLSNMFFNHTVKGTSDNRRSGTIPQSPRLRRKSPPPHRNSPQGLLKASCPSTCAGTSAPHPPPFSAWLPSRSPLGRQRPRHTALYLHKMHTILVQSDDVDLKMSRTVVSFDYRMSLTGQETTGDILTPRPRPIRGVIRFSVFFIV